MAIQRSLLLIADIGGYTRFMKEHRFALAHAQEAVASLLEAVIDAAEPFELAKLEGDAAFLYAPAKGSARDVGRAVASIRTAFLAKQKEMQLNRLCTCKGCTETDLLKLKFVAHEGEVAFQKVKRFTELAGVDVILVHRMLKNDVPVPEYVLMTEPVHGALDAELKRFARELTHDFEGLGKTRTHYVDLAEVHREVPHALQKSKAARWFDRFLLVLRSLPMWLGLKKACAGFRNIEGELAPALTDSSTRTPVS